MACSRENFTFTFIANAGQNFPRYFEGYLAFKIFYELTPRIVVEPQKMFCRKLELSGAVVGKHLSQHV
jgi:hypothetical protein